MKRGFTLLEVLVALAIFAVAALAVVQAASGHIRSLSVLEEKLLASWVAENQQALLALMPAAERVREQQGQATLGGHTWYWRSKPVKTQAPLLQAIDLSVSPKASMSPTVAVLRSYFSRDDRAAENP
ncbi:MAG: type II secretion system minor pseudopilin GspI [Plesiomonas sp.]|uniref:type II secretion system minor pseudopilin GspI n=1 Tax=Plesiomonas sp. TaxID=2486279 RepID=UPI003F36026C